MKFKIYEKFNGELIILRSIYNFTINDKDLLYLGEVNLDVMEPDPSYFMFREREDL